VWIQRHGKRSSSSEHPVGGPASPAWRAIFAWKAISTSMHSTVCPRPRIYHFRTTLISVPAGSVTENVRGEIDVARIVRGSGNRGCAAVRGELRDVIEDVDGTRVEALRSHCEAFPFAFVVAIAGRRAGGVGEEHGSRPLFQELFHVLHPAGARVCSVDHGRGTRLRALHDAL